MNKKKQRLLKELRTALDDWESIVKALGNECAWTDSYLYAAGEILKELSKIE